ncbi:MAG TPA: hypothetical protein VHL59_14180 [Thermoanaerobaculia bacterium]|nr:hypothetical protein [Thermoanaerobaculia bacterium]
MIVRLPERRQGMRILTLKNAVWVLVGLVAFFILFSAYNEHSPRDASRDSLSQRRAEGPPAATARKPAAAPDTPVAEEEAVVEPEPPPPAPPVVPVRTPARTPTLKETRQRGGRVVITGGAEGVQVEVRPARKSPPP